MPGLTSVREVAALFCPKRITAYSESHLLRCANKLKITYLHANLHLLDDILVVGNLRNLHSLLLWQLRYSAYMFPIVNNVPIDVSAIHNKREIINIQLNNKAFSV